MFVIQCPECMTRFKVSEEALGDGKDVRCGECQHVWFQTPPDGDDISVEGGTTKPVIHENTFDEELAEAVVDVPDAIAPDTGRDALRGKSNLDKNGCYCFCITFDYNDRGFGGLAIQYCKNMAKDRKLLQGGCT